MSYQQSTAHVQEIKAGLARDNTEWRFNPPAAPHFGGIWEAAVKSTKYHIRRVLGDNTLTYEEMATLLTQIEACLNSRPLTTLTEDPSDVQPLTPAHFLIQAPSYIVPEPSYIQQNIPASHRWQIVQQMMQGFWHRWSPQEYLQSLQKLQKWQTPTRSFKVNDLVILRGENTPPAQWPLARILAVQPNSKGLVRTVTLRTANSTFYRPAVKLILLPKDEDEMEEDTKEEDAKEENAKEEKLKKNYEFIIEFRALLRKFELSCTKNEVRTIKFSIFFFFFFSSSSEF